MTNLSTPLDAAIENQKTTGHQYILLKVILDNHSPYEGLGEAAIEMCKKLCKNSSDLVIAESKNSASIAESAFDFLLYDKDPNENIPKEIEEVEEGADYEQDDPDEWDADFNPGMRDEVEALVDFCANGGDVIEGLKQVNLIYVPPKEYTKKSLG